MLEEKIREAHSTFKDYASVCVGKREVWDNRIFYLASGSLVASAGSMMIYKTPILSGGILLAGMGTSYLWYLRNKFKFDVPFESMDKVYRAKINEVFLSVDSDLNKSEGLISGLYFNNKLVFDDRFGIRSNNRMVAIENNHSFYMRKKKGVYRVGEVCINNHRYVARGDSEDRFTIRNRGIYISIESPKLPKGNFHLNNIESELNEFMGMKKKKEVDGLCLYTNEDNAIFKKNFLEELDIEDESLRVSIANGSLNLYLKYMNNYLPEDGFKNPKKELERLNAMVEGYYRALNLIEHIYDNLAKVEELKDNK